MWQELQKLVRLAAPLSLVHAGNQLMAVVDTAIVGRVGAVELGAVGVANGLYMFFMILGLGVMLSLDPLISQAIGAGDPLRARRLLWQGVWLATGVSLVLSLPMALAPTMLVPMGIEAETARLAGIYLLVRVVGLQPALLFCAQRSYLQALGSTRPMVLAMLAGNVLNLALTWLLVFGSAGLPGPLAGLFGLPPLGVAGAAVATVFTQLAQCGILAVAVRARPIDGAHAAPPPGARRADPVELRGALRVGLPIGLQLMTEVGIFALVGLLAGRLGTLELAAHQISLTLASLSFTVALGVGAAGAVRVGLAVGAGDGPGARRAGTVALVAGGSFMALSALALWAFPAGLARLLTDDPAAVAASVPLLAVAAVFQLSDGLQAVGAGVLRGAGDTRFAFLANLVGHWFVGLPVSLGLGFGLGYGVGGLWWGLCAGLTAVAVALTVRFRVISARPLAPLAAKAAP